MPDGPATRMVRPERRVGYVLIAIMASAVAYSWTADILNGDGKALLQAAIGLVLLGGLAAALWYGHRLITAFAAMAAGFAPVKPSITAIVFVGLTYGGILSFRDTRIRKAATMALPRRSPRHVRTRSIKAVAAVADGTHTPGASRRYTPPKAKHPGRDR